MRNHNNRHPNQEMSASKGVIEWSRGVVDRDHWVLWHYIITPMFGIQKEDISKYISHPLLQHPPQHHRHLVVGAGV
jgi:hypothetical protein